MEIELNQRGRAATDFMVALALTQGDLAKTVAADMAVAKLADDNLADDYVEREEQVLSAMKMSKAFQLDSLINEWLSVNHGLVAIDAFEEIRDFAEPELARRLKGVCSLTLNPDCDTPQYWLDHDIHRTTGGWNGHEHMGFIHREIIHNRYLAAKYPWQIFKQRRDVLNELPKGKAYSDIFEMGCGTGNYTGALSEVFPDARLSGCDLSAPLLQEVQRIANQNDWRWQLYQAAAEQTGLPDASFDLVTSYILLHELPVEAIRAVFKEALRLLKPGAVMMMADARPLRDMDKLAQWRTLHDAKYGGEPFWQESASLDMPAVLRDLGFVNIQSYGLGDNCYPWVTIGEKP